MGVLSVDSAGAAKALALRLLMRDRRRPAVVLTVAAGHDQPFGDPAEIDDALGDLAEVVLIQGTEASWAFSGEMPPMTQVYGGAGRVYPVDHGWVSMPARSRLRFAYSTSDGRRITEQLINDALEAALAAGLLTGPAAPGLRRRVGKVAGVIDSRAVVTLDDGAPATVWEELTLPGVALDRVLVKGQPVEGGYDNGSRRLDLRGEVRYTDAQTALAAVLDAYEIGDVVLADVAAVTDGAVSLRLLPGLTVEVDKAAVTSNPNDTLRELFTLGEVVAGRIAGTGPLRLRLDDIDDDEAPKPALSLLPGGPPWLDASPPPEPVPEPVVVVTPVVQPPPAPRRPSPLDLARRNTVTAVPAPDAGSLDKERARVAELTNELAAERSTRKVLALELNDLRLRAAQLEADRDRAVQSKEGLKTRYRSADLARQRAVKEVKAVQGRAVTGPSGPAFANPAEQFRHEVYTEWVQRIPAAEKAEKPLANYTLGPEFLDSLAKVEGVSRAKVVAVVVEVLTGQVQHLPGRDLHQLRESGAGSRYIKRPDGATCWRVALQQDTAAARRMHYWRLGKDEYELSRVLLHDDFRP